MIDYKTLFHMRDPLKSSPMRLGFFDHRPDREWLLKVFRGEIQPETPIRLIQKRGKEIMNILWSTSINIFVVSEKVIELFDAQGITGWRTYSVEIYTKRKNLLSGFYGFAITGRAGSLDISRGEIIAKPPPRVGGKSYEVLKGFYLQEDQWDCSDLCISRFGGRIIATNRITNLMLNEKIDNVEFTPLCDVELDLDALKISGSFPR